MYIDSGYSSLYVLPFAIAIVFILQVLWVKYVILLKKKNKQKAIELKGIFHTTKRAIAAVIIR